MSPDRPCDGTRVRTRPAAALVVLLCALGLAGGATGAMVGGVHDFVDDGFTGGGACAACHVPHGADPGESRLWPRGGLSGTVPARLCMDCHDGSMPTGAGWPATWTGTPPPPPGAHISDVAGDNAALSCRDQGQENCGTCHAHANGFAMVGGCFDCHTTEAEQLLAWGSVVFPDATDQCMQVDREFDGIGAVADAGLLSQHNIADNAAGCQRCHGSGHPGDAGLLAYPDDRGGNSLGDVVARSADYSTYQEFCLACHDGQDVSGVTSFGGPLGTAQVAPSLRSNPAQQQAGPTWVTPAVPPRDGGSGENLPPFFDYYETNGHGAANAPLTNNPMDVTCLAGGAGQGCHSAHGSQNRFLVGDGLFGPGIASISDMATGLCYDCHIPGVLIGAGTASMFHGWIGGGTILHDDTIDATADGMSQMRVLAANMNITNLPGTVTPPVPPASGIMPFYGGIAGAVFARSFPGDMTAGGPYWVSCLTCHDPHGTGPATRVAMTRIDPDFATYDDLYQSPLCGECHN